MLNASNCSICGAIYVGGHCPNCGWFASSNVKSPARCCEHRWAGPVEPTHPTKNRRQVPMALSVAGGVARPRLYEVGTNPGPAIEVHEIDVQQLTASLNAIRNHILPAEGEVTAFTTMLAAAVEYGRSMAGVA